MTSENSEQLEGQEAIDLWLSGKDKWNAWAADNKGTTVSFVGVDFSQFKKKVRTNSAAFGSDSTDFQGYVFPGPVNFKACNFGSEGVIFLESRFEGETVTFGGAQFGGSVNFGKAVFLCDKVYFSKARFVGNGDLSFAGASFSDGYVSFKKATIEKRIVFFNGTAFGNGAVNFYRTMFRSESVRFIGVDFSEGEFCFSSVKCPNGNIQFDGCKFSQGDFYFRNATFPSESVSFKGASFSNGSLIFKNAKFGSSDIDFSNSRFKDVDVSFEDVTFTKENILFEKAHFDNSDLSFEKVNFGSGNVNFKRMSFEGGLANFKSVSFTKGNVCFEGTRFNGCDIDFNKAHFSKCEVINFSGITVKGMSNFAESVFDSTIVDFNKASFEGPVSFIDSIFSTIPDFTLTKFTNHTVTSDMDITYPSLIDHNSICSKYPNVSDTVKLRRLKELAANSKDHKLELDFFAEELKAKRFYDTVGISLIPSYLYQWSSDFGRSMKRPLVALLILWIICTGFFYFAVKDLPKAKETTYTSGLQYVVNPAIEDSWLFSMSNLVPFIHWTKETRLIYKTKYFKNADDIPTLVHLVVILEGILSLIFLALFSLGIRNRFRI